MYTCMYVGKHVFRRAPCIQYITSVSQAVFAVLYI